MRNAVFLVLLSTLVPAPVALAQEENVGIYEYDGIDDVYVLQEAWLDPDATLPSGPDAFAVYAVTAIGGGGGCGGCQPNVVVGPGESGTSVPDSVVRASKPVPSRSSAPDRTRSPSKSDLPVMPRQVVTAILFLANTRPSSIHVVRRRSSGSADGMVMAGVTRVMSREAAVDNGTLCSAEEPAATSAACSAIHRESISSGSGTPVRGSIWSVVFADGLRRSYIVNNPFSSATGCAPVPGSSCH
jgi:hypothetical protein